MKPIHRSLPESGDLLDRYTQTPAKANVALVSRGVPERAVSGILLAAWFDLTDGGWDVS